MDRLFLPNRVNGDVLFFSQVDVNNGDLASAPTDKFDTSGTGAVSQQHMLAVAATTQRSTSTNGAASIVVLGLSGAPCAAVHESYSARVMQRHALVPEVCIQGNDSPSVFVGQVVYEPGFVNLIGSTSWRVDASGIGRLAQVHAIAALACQQANASASRSVELSFGSVDMNSFSCAQSAVSTTGAVTQEHGTRAAACAQAGASPAVLLSQNHKIAGHVAVGSSISSAGAVVHLHVIRAESCASSSASSIAAVVHIHALVGLASLQPSLASRVAISQVHLIAGESAIQENRCVVGVMDATIRTLSGAPASQANGSATGAVRQAHRLADAEMYIAHDSGVSVIDQLHGLRGANATASSVSQPSVVLQDHVLVDAGTSQQNFSSNHGARVSHQLLTQADATGSIAGVGEIVVTHDLSILAALQRNLSLGSGVTCVQELIGHSVRQINLSQPADLSGKVSIFMPPESDRFRFSAESSSGNSDNW